MNIFVTFSVINTVIYVSAGKLSSLYQENSIFTNIKTNWRGLESFQELEYFTCFRIDLFSFFLYFLGGVFWGGRKGCWFFFWRGVLVGWEGYPCRLYCSSCVCSSVFCLYIAGFNKMQPGTVLGLLCFGFFL